MKLKRILCSVLTVLLVLPFLCACNTVEEPVEILYYDSGDNLETYTMENEFLKFTMTGENSYFTLEDKTTGQVWSSIPVDAANDSRADTTMKKWLQSTLILTYTVTSGLNTIFDNYTYSILNGTFQITQTESSIRVDYLIGQQERIFIIPEAVSVERFQELIGQMEKKEQSSIKGVYSKLDQDDLQKSEDPEALLAKYPLLATEEAIYIRRESAAAYRFEAAEEIFAKYGYTEEDYENDKAVKVEEEDKIQFNVSVEYTLEGNSMAVNIPGDSIRCRDSEQLTNLQVLPYFGAGSSEEEGFLLIPDGGGAMLDFNSRKGNASSITSKMYGWDMTRERAQMITENKVSYPVFGIQKGESFLLTIAEEGIGDLTLTTNLSGNRNGYNSITPSFEIIHGDLVYVSSKSLVQVMVYEKVRLYEDYQLRYFAGAGDSYVDMANTYRDYLMEKHPELTEQDDTSMPVAVELVGALDHITQVLGIPMQQILPATTYAEAIEIISSIQSMGIDNLHVKYNGILNGGVKQTSLLKTSLVSQLGTKSELQALVDLLEASGDKLYLGAYGTHVFDSAMFDGFSSTQDAVRNTLSDIVEAYPYNKVTYQQTGDPYFILNAEATVTAGANLSSFASQYGFSGVSFNDIGAYVNSDFSKEKPMSRNNTAAIHAQVLKAAKESGQGIMIDCGNDYAVVYADFVLNMDLQGSSYDLVSRQVPFYQIALHGLVSYAGEPINMAENYEYNLLKSIETGAGLYFLFADISAAELQMTEYGFYSSANFSAWKDSMTELYQDVNSKLGHVYNQKITDHVYLTEQVTCTVYEDGTQVIVNYGNNAYESEFGTIESMDYLVAGGNK